MLHSILSATDDGYGADYYYWDTLKFDQLCKCISHNPEISCITTNDFLNVKKGLVKC